ncbi:MAG: MobA/MobL family protein [Vampirovibrionales bacterium]
MAIYRLSASVISRSTERSATAAAAYRAGERIRDKRTATTFDYTKRSGIEHTEILAPDSAPDWMRERPKLWNAVEIAEKRKDSQLTREVQLALPHELNAEQRLEQWCESWQQHVNQALERTGEKERVDHRSYEAQGIDKKPEPKQGATATKLERQGIETNAGNDRRAVQERNAERLNIKAELMEIENQRLDLANALKEEKTKMADYEKRALQVEKEKVQGGRMEPLRPSQELFTPQRVSQDLSIFWEQSERKPIQFQETMERFGYRLAETKDQRLVIVDPAGGLRDLRRVKGVDDQAITKQMRDLDKPIPDIKQAKMDQERQFTHGTTGQHKTPLEQKHGQEKQNLHEQQKARRMAEESRQKELADHQRKQLDDRLAQERQQAERTSQQFQQRFGNNRLKSLALEFNPFTRKDYLAEKQGATEAEKRLANRPQQEQHRRQNLEDKLKKDSASLDKRLTSTEKTERLQLERQQRQEGIKERQAKMQEQSEQRQEQARKDYQQSRDKPKEKDTQKPSQEQGKDDPNDPCRKKRDHGWER